MNELADLYEIDLTNVRWHKSSYTASNGNCVEVTTIPGKDAVAVRDSKNSHIAPIRVSSSIWATFVDAVASATIAP